MISFRMGAAKELDVFVPEQFKIQWAQIKHGIEISTNHDDSFADPSVPDTFLPPIRKFQGCKHFFERCPALVQVVQTRHVVRESP